MTTEIRRPAGSGVDLRPSKVPEITPYFWLLVVLAGAVGQTVAGHLAAAPGRPAPALAAGAALTTLLAAQLRAARYRPALYWAVLVGAGSAAAWLLRDPAVPLGPAAVAVTAALSLAFLRWYAGERRMRIHPVVSRRHEGFYWAAALLTLALGAAVSRLLLDRLQIGALPATGLVAAAVTLLAVARFGFRLPAGPAFWSTLGLTWSLGASAGELLDRGPAHGGLGIGPTQSAGVLAAALLAVVWFLTESRADDPEPHPL